MSETSDSPRRWAPAKFREALRRGGLTSEVVSVWLADRGLTYSASTVRRWTWGGSRGPRHPQVADLLRGLVEELEVR